VQCKTGSIRISSSLDFTNKPPAIKYNHASTFGRFLQIAYTIDTTMNVKPAQSSELEKSLKRRLAGDVFCDAYTRSLYSTDASMYQMMPHGVLIPKTLEDVHAAVELAAQYKMPILPRTGGSSLVVSWHALK
jgi:hypothetical protein